MVDHAASHSSGSGPAGMIILGVIAFAVVVGSINSFVRTVRGDPDSYVTAAHAPVVQAAVTSSSIRRFNDQSGGLAALTRWCTSEGGNMVGNQCIRAPAPQVSVTQVAAAGGIRRFNDAEGGRAALERWCATQGGHMDGNLCRK